MNEDNHNLAAHGFLDLIFNFDLYNVINLFTKRKKKKTKNEQSYGFFNPHLFRKDDGKIFLVEKVHAVVSMQATTLLKYAITLLRSFRT